MAKIVKDRAVVLRDPQKGNAIRVFTKGMEIPEHMEDQVTNGAVTGNDEEESFENTNSSSEDSSEPSTSSETTEESEGEDLSDFDRMDDEFTVPELVNIAKEEDVDLKGLTKKADIIQAILDHRADNS